MTDTDTTEDIPFEPPVMDVHYGANGEPEQVYPTPEHQAAWEAYRAHPAYQIAVAKFQHRVTEMQPLIQALEALELMRNQELSNAQLTFQERVHEPMYELTRRLMVLDAKYPEQAEQVRSQAQGRFAVRIPPNGAVPGESVPW